MFTNWLTDSTGLTNAPRSAANSNTTARLPDNNNHLSNVKLSNAAADLSLLGAHNFTNLNSHIMSTSPDIILEVGPAPTTMRFMAHGLVLGMHSGYLRSAIRLDERSASGGSGAGAPTITNSSVGGIAGGVPDIIVYLTNVTAEQFAPLLTYMYTGYLDLNVENIFGVLLATHVLHMPRALEICRSYLARAQTEGYFAPNNNATLASTNPHVVLSAAAATTTANSSCSSSSSGGKVIRPIASKPQLTTFGFLPMGHQPLALKALPADSSLTPHAALEHDTKSTKSSDDANRNEEEDDIEVDEVVDKQSLYNDKQISVAGDDEEEEDVEVFIDSNSETELVVETQIEQKMPFRKLLENKKSFNEIKDNKTKQHKKSSHHCGKSERRKKGTSGLQVAKAPIPASQLDCSEANKVIIDVASCDGPVRFKRILNTAYGHKPDVCLDSNGRPAAALGPVMPERSLQSVSLSFHQQMAKTISQQQQLQHTEESENSETSNGSIMATMRAAEKASIGNRKTNAEVFVCVYCKHTFKSQYCYQKHAKRHLNPLTLQATCVPEGKVAAKDESAAAKGGGGAGAGGELQITKHQNLMPTTTRAYFSRPSSTHAAYPASAATNSSSTSSSTDYLRREVRPLDMNVQYYPCKTCGCKFPSYYFVHKHRKMCHAEEEIQQGNADNNNNNNNSHNNAAQNSSTVASSTTTSVGNSGNAEECLNSQSSD